jgi:tetratricopeptide (TPR) repeat protein
MAPEQAKGQEVDQRADIYALGLIFYDMLIGGRRAERAASAVAELQERMQTAPPAPRTLDAQIPETVDAIVKRCLEPDPAKRFQTTVELHNALERLDENGKPLPMIRRLTRRTMIAATLVVLLLLGGTYYVTRWLSAPPTEHAPVTVMVADFQNNTSDPSFDSTLAQTVRRALEDASFISAYDRTRVSALGVRAPDKLPELAARELAVKQGVGVILAGLIQPSGNGFDLSMKATETVTGSTIASVQNRAANKDQVLATATRLVARVRKALGDETSESAQLLAMRTLSTSSLDVLSHYAAAVEAQSKGRYEDARQSYLRAIELDPQFGLGYQGLAAISRNLGQVEASEKYIGEAVSNLDRMTARERFATRGLSYLFSGDLRLCEKEYGDLVQQFPADTVGRGQRAGCLAKLRKLPEAIAEMQEAVRMLPNHAVYRSNLALLYDLAGEFDKAETEVRAIQEPQARALVPLAYSQLGRELLPDAVASYERIGKMGPLGASIASSGLADVAIYQGRFSNAVTLLEEGAAADLTAKNVERAAIKFTSLAYAELMAGHKDRAVAAADKALANGKAMAVRFLAARIFAEAGQLDKARALAAALSAETPQEPQAHGKLLEGLIALKRGNARDAIRIFTEANALLDTWFGHFDLGRAYLQDGAKLQADSEFDRCVVRRGEALSLMDEGPTFGHFPAVYYYRGRVREEMKTAGYADSYREYLKIRGASTEDPLVPDIRRRVGN